MTERNPLLHILQQLTTAAALHGTAFLKCEWHPDRDEWVFNVIDPEFVTISYEKGHDND